MSKKYQMGLLAASLVLPACVIKNVNSNQQGQGQESGTGPTDSPSPTAQCALVQLAAGCEADVTQIDRGATVNCGVSLIGQQGLELADLCVAQFQASWSGGAPCTLAAHGFQASLTAPSGAAVGAVCRATVHVGTKTDSVELEVR